MQILNPSSPWPEWVAFPRRPCPNLGTHNVRAQAQSGAVEEAWIAALAKEALTNARVFPKGDNDEPGVIQAKPALWQSLTAALDVTYRWPIIWRWRLLLFHSYRRL